MEKLDISDFFETLLFAQMEEIAEHQDLPEHHGCCLDTLEHKSYEGFMSTNNGGINLALLTDLQTIDSSGNPHTGSIALRLDIIIEQALKDALAAFCERHKDELSKLFTDDELINANDHVSYHSLCEIEQHKLAEILSEYETEHLSEGGHFWYQFRIIYYKADNHLNMSGVDELYFIAGVNLDFEYGRDKGLITTFDKTIKHDDLSVNLIKETIEAIVQSITGKKS